jgi:hypothetical protein
VLFGPGGNLYVTGHGNDDVLIYDSSGNPIGSTSGDNLTSGGALMTFTLTDPVTLAYVPEASTWILFSLGLAALAVAWGRRRKVNREPG